MPFLSGKSSDCSFSPIHGCLRFCLYTTLKQLGNLLLLTLEMWPRAKKKNIFCLWKLDSHGLKPARKAHTYSFLWPSFCFLKEIGCLPLLLGSHLTVQYHLIREMTGMELKTKKHSPQTAFLMEWCSVS